MHSFIRVALLLTLLGCAGCARDYNFHEGILSFRLQNYRDAFVRLMPEALKGRPEAEYAVGYMYYYGEGVVANRAKALHWIRLAARHGQADAVTALQMIEREPDEP